MVPVFDMYQRLRMAAPRPPVGKGRSLSAAKHHLACFQRDEADRTFRDLRWQVPRSVRGGGGKRDGDPPPPPEREPEREPERVLASRALAS